MTDRYAVHGAQGEFQPGSNDLVLANKLGIQSPAPAGTEEKTPVETPVQTLEEMPVEIPVAMHLKTPDQILRVLRQQPTWSLAAVAQAIGKSTSAVERAVAKLVKSGQLRRVGSTKTGHWEVMHD